ncbi:FtsX-like permease family protein, partial [Hungatella sp.]
NRQKLADETADARKELEDAREKLADLKEPETYVLGRDKNIGYACFESDSDIVEGISNVFPIFFFLVAALVCITTMTRMVEEQRTQIGILKALGYSEGTIMGKYLFYSGSAAVLGCGIGFLLGSYIFPVVIWSAYRIMYRLGDIRIILDWKLGLISLIVSILCSMGTTIATCRYELTSVAAELMRPKAPKSGKRIILERIPFLWNRMKFLRKVSARNIFRYKQRFYMMVFGIGGCTALLLTGFGIKDSIKSITYNQFDEIQINDMSVVFNDPWYEMDNSDFEEIMAENAERYTLVFEESTDLTKGDKSKSLTLVIPEKAEDISSFLNLHTTRDVPIAFPGKGEVVLTEKLADKCGAGIGDMVTLQDDDMNTLELKVSGISENYVYNYAYISPETWMEQIGSAPEYKSAYINVKEEKDVHSVSAAVMNCDGVASVTVNADMKVRFSSMMKSLDYVVLLIIGCAGSLAFIVLYNLTNINITERLREIATIKVLGFYRRETASYVFRENLVLTGIGAGVGLIMGRYLHQFVMYNIDIDMIAFDVHIAPLSVLYSIVLTFVFAGIVDWAMNKKLDGINMAESMKSVE